MFILNGSRRSLFMIRMAMVRCIGQYWAPLEVILPHTELLPVVMASFGGV